MGEALDIVLNELPARFLRRCSSVACAKHNIPQWGCDSEVGIGVVVMDVMIGGPVSSKDIMKTMVVDGEMAQSINNIA